MASIREYSQRSRGEPWVGCIGTPSSSLLVVEKAPTKETFGLLDDASAVTATLEGRVHHFDLGVAQNLLSEKTEVRGG